ncbi:hypothetical protein BAE44_0021863 [Dichanthelium oligosanthes]|uniref:DUF4378 domain-containing protein n=1 Tax=Dichanthelium oligosanthes TaxID=888268 RepID=A0A1E5UW67_9POAL|nr:hypothetical protein BAE44_0021863 [Dichanthelium oligosanthes]
MACLSPSPSGRRLSELLEEKQEPFCLDLHLLEKGCSSSRLLDGYDTAMCWPAPGNDAAAAVLRRLTSKRTKAAKKKPQAQSQQAGGLLRLLLSKILRGRGAAPPRKPAALQFSDSFKMAAASNNPAAVAPAPSPRSGHLDAVKTTEDDAKEASAESCYSDCDDSDDEKQQLSPVSVLEPHPFESSPVHGKLLSSPSKHAMDVFRELLDAAYSPALLTQLLAKTTDDLLKDADDEDDYYYGSNSYRTSPKNCRDDESAALYWDTHRAELARVSELVASEVPSSKLAAADVQPERQDVGAEVEAAVFEALLLELVVDLRSSGWC